MKTVNVTELRQHLPTYLKLVQAGQEFSITQHGRPVARIVPSDNSSERENAQARLAALRGRMIVGDVMAPVDAAWSADADHL